MSPSEKPWPNGTPSFGSEMRKEFLMGSSKLNSDVAFCNHGSYGATPKVVMDERIKLLMETEDFPDLWYRQTEESMYNNASQRAATFLGTSHVESMSLLTNTTTGVNTVLKSLELQPEDVILCTSHNYSAVLNAADDVVTRANADLLSIDMPSKIESEQQILDLFEQTLSLKKAVRLAIVDHISSASAILYPIKKITKILHEHNILVLADGAHGPGQADFSIDDLGVDFYVASLHKWCYAPKGCGLLWVSPKLLDCVRPLIVSHYYKRTLKDELFMQGTSDLTRYNALPKALDFYESIGGRTAITAYTNTLLDFAVDLLCKALDVHPQDIPDEMRAPNMRVIGFPDLSVEDGVVPSHSHANDLTLELVKDYKAVSCFMHFNGKYWLRLSANVYNTRDDYIKLSDAVVQLVKDKREKAHLARNA